MSQATFSIRMDESLKKQFDSLCKEFGMNTSTAINVFARTVVRERKIPFEISVANTVSLSDGKTAFDNLRASAKQNRIQDLSLDEINSEIQQARNSI